MKYQPAESVRKVRIYLSSFLFLCWHIYCQHVAIHAHLQAREGLQKEILLFKLQETLFFMEAHPDVFLAQAREGCLQAQNMLLSRARLRLELSTASTRSNTYLDDVCPGCLQSTGQKSRFPKAMITKQVSTLYRMQTSWERNNKA